MAIHNVAFSDYRLYKIREVDIIVYNKPTILL